MFSTVEQEAPQQRCGLCVLQTLCLLIFAILLTTVNVAFAQVGPPSITAQQRERLYRDIARETPSLKSQFSLLKKVVKVVRPTVVHIEINGGNFRRNRLPDETGSVSYTHLRAHET